MKYLLFALIILLTSCKKSNTDIEQPKLASITLNASVSNIVLGESLQLAVSYLPANAAKPEYDWSSSNQNILSITSEGLITAKSIGTATITVKAKGSYFTSEHKITVIPGTITSLTVDKPNINLFVTQEQQINVSILPASALSAPIKWLSSDPSVVQVTSAGLVTALSPGISFVTASSADGKVTAVSNVVVLPEVKYTRNIFDKIKTELLDQLILYNEQQGKALAKELSAGKLGYVVQAVTVAGITALTSSTTNPGYPEAEFSKLKMPSEDILRINSNFYMELFPTTSRYGTLTLDINFLEKAWELKGTREKKYTFRYSDDVTLSQLKAIIDQNIADVRRYVTTGSY